MGDRFLIVVWLKDVIARLTCKHEFKFDRTIVLDGYKYEHYSDKYFCPKCLAVRYTNKRWRRAKL